MTMPAASIDFETYSEAGYVWDGSKWRGLPNSAGGKKGLSVVGAAGYAKHHTTEVICLAYDMHRGEGVQLWTPYSGRVLKDLFEHIQYGGLVEAWNSSFEGWIWSEVCHARMGWPELPIRQLRCTMGRARAFGLPGSLGKAGEVMRLSVQKDKAGDALIKKYCVPRQPTIANKALRASPVDPALYEYCKTDVLTESEASSRVPNLEGGELKYWLCDQAINRRGVHLDVKGVNDCCAIIDQALEKYNTELRLLTNGVVEKASQVSRLTEWLRTYGVHMNSLDEDTVDVALTWELPDAARRALEIRQAVGSAAVKKAYAMRNRATEDGVLHDLLIYHGARTGRCTGEGPQPTNLPNSGPEVSQVSGIYVGKHWGLPTEEWSAEAAQYALDSVISTQDLDYVELIYGDALAAVSGCLRGLFVAAPGNRLICSDYSAIEAVVLAELAGEEWRMEVFRTHGKIYETSASKISGVSLEEFDEYKQTHGKHHPLRKLGKVAELASGYGGGLGAWKAFGADEHFKNDNEMYQAIHAWRDASPKVVALWKGYENCAISCVQDPTCTYTYNGVSFFMNGSVMQIRLLSGRCLTYHDPQVRPGDRGLSISFMGWNSNPKYGAMGWVRMDTWGGKLTENVVQATAADILRHATLNLEAAGYPLVLHVYDEVVCDVPAGHGSVEELEAIMVTLPDWAKGWPIRASGGWEGKRYRK